MTGIGFHLSESLRSEDNIVRLRSLKFNDSEFGLAPDNTIPALRITTEERVRSGIHLASGNFDVPGLVLHPVEISIPEDAMIATAGSLPRGIVFQHDVAGFGMMQFQTCSSRYSIDEIIMDKKLTTTSDVGDFPGKGGETKEGNEG